MITPLPDFAGTTILCIGDAMVDRYVYGDVTRLSPEAPVPVLRVRREEIAGGGAANVALNLAALGVRAVLVSSVGADTAGDQLLSVLQASAEVDARLMRLTDRPTPSKVRFVSDQPSAHLLRADWEEAAPLPADAARRLAESAEAALPECAALILSDYGKGVLPPQLVTRLIFSARAAGLPVIVDPKGADYTVYRGASVVTPNLAELAEAVRRRPLTVTREIVAAAEELAHLAGIGAVLVTRGEDGMTLVVPGEEPIHIATAPAPGAHVSGAGDTAVAALAAMLASGASLEAAARVANAAASVVVAKRGTATVTAKELREMLSSGGPRPRLGKVCRGRAQLAGRLAGWRECGLRIGFTNGCFDLLHPGHVKVLAEAREACDRLVVGINSDASARRLKGVTRPIQSETARAEVIAALESVDLVAFFEEDTPLDLIRHVRPDVLVKGADYAIDQVVGRDEVESYGGRVMLVELLPEVSTSRLVTKARL